jgi:hypothetical protein
MRKLTWIALASGFLIAASLAKAQRPGGEGPGAGQRPPGGGDLVARMMEFDNDKDGKLTKAEVTDERLLRLFDRADDNKDGIVTKEELTALAAREPAGGGNRGGGPPGFGPPDGGPGGPRMGGGPPPRPGEVLPSMLQQRLNLTAAQTKQVADLQKEVDARLEKILTEEQREQFKQMRERGPGGFGPPGRGGRPPGGDGPPPPPPPPPPPRSDQSS